MKMTVKNGYFSYDETALLKNINFEVNDGEMVTIIGPNGVGKTTLLKCLLGFHPWTQGETLINGQLIQEVDKKNFWKKVSYVPQIKKIPLSYDVESMILMGRNPFVNFFGQPKKEDMRAVHDVLELLNMKKYRHKIMGELSGGEKQMVLIGRALVSQPELMIFDEPELNLDLANQDKMYLTLKQLVSYKKISCLINTHHPFNAYKYSDHSLLLKKDLNYQYGETRTIVTRENIIDAFGLSKDYFDISIKSLEEIGFCKSS